MSMFEEAAKYAKSVVYEDLPAEVIDIAKRAMIDYSGVVIAGSHDQESEVIQRYVRQIASRPEAGLVGCKDKASIHLAALANSFAGHVLDFDDNALPVGHPSVVVLPVLFAIGETIGASGKDILTAYITSYQVESAISDTFERVAWFRGWHMTCIGGIFGATTAASLLLGLTEEQFVNALGIATSQASGIKGNFGTRTKPYQVGSTASKGVEAAILASYGINSSPIAMEATDGYFKIITGSPYEGQKANFKGPWYMLEPGIQFKLYPACSGVFTAIESIVKLATENDIRPEDVAKIYWGTDKSGPRMIICHNPVDVSGARFSFEYCAAAPLVLRTGGLKAFTEEAVADPRIRELMTKVEIKVEDELSEPYRWTHPSRVKIIMKDGRKFVRRCDAPRGVPGNQLNDAEFSAKFMECTEKWMAPEQSKSMLNDLFEMEKVANIGDFTSKMYL